MLFPIDTVKTHYESPLGVMVLAAARGQLVGTWFDGQAHQPDTRPWPENAAEPVFKLAIKQLNDYFAGRRRSFDLPTAFAAGTVFQQQIWDALRVIPCGETTSYGLLGASIGRPKAVRAVGAAVGRNPLSIIVPCHRVVGATGALTGYAGGLARKTALLQLEGAFFKPLLH